MNNFVFNNKNSFEDMGLITLGGISRTKTQEVIENIPVEGRLDGSLTRKTKSYKDIIIERTLRLTDFNDYEIKCKKIVDWLENFEDKKLVFDDMPSKKYIVKNVVCGNFVDYNHLYSDINVKFICNPFLQEVYEPRQTITNGATIINIGDIESQPNIYLTLPNTTQNIQIDINGEVFLIKDVKTNLNINSSLFTAYSENISKRTQGSFPTLKKGANVVKWVGNIDKFEIEKNTLYRG